MSGSGQEVATFILVSMAKASLLAWLAFWALSVQLAGTCLRCWPDAAEYFSYDAHLLLQDAETSDKLDKLFLGSPEDRYYYGYLEREQMEREAGNLFLRLEQSIQKNGNDHEQFMKDAEQEKKDFDKKLEEASDAFLKEICSLSCGKSRYKPYKVAKCKGCQVLTAPCLDPVVCAGPNVVAAVLVTLLLLGLIIGGIVYYCRRKKSKGGGEAREREEKESSSDSIETSEWSDDSVPSLPKYYNIPTYENIPREPPYDEVPQEPVYDEVPREPPYEEVPREPPYEEVPRTPKGNIPSPPEFNIPSPSAFQIPSPPELNLPSPPRHNIPSPPAGFYDY